MAFRNRILGPAKAAWIGVAKRDIISLLCDIAVRTGEKITWDPKKQELVGASEKAKAMLTRPMRAPWTL